MQAFLRIAERSLRHRERRLGASLVAILPRRIVQVMPSHQSFERSNRECMWRAGSGVRVRRRGRRVRPTLARPQCSHRRTVKHAQRTTVAAVPLPVVAGAQLMCSFGVAPSAFMVTPEGKTLFENKPVGTILDNIPFKNIMPFGVCTSLANPITAAQTAAALGVLTPGTCLPVIPAPWAPPCPTVMVANKPAFNQTAKCMCAYGGVIQVLNPGATTEQIP